jgi:hypothetical protein
MRKIYFIFISLLFIAGTAFSQKVNVDIKKTLNPPVIDGVEEAIWDQVDPVAAEKPLFDEVPTVTVYWKAMWDDTAVYVLFNVEDDDHYTAEESGGNDWEYDKPEIYFDINDTLVDNFGPQTASSGHWQVAPAFLAANEGIEVFHDNWNEHGADDYDSYVLTGSNYVREYRIPWKGMYTKDFDTLTVQKAVQAGWVIGFDICIIDQDEGITTARQRIVWQNDGNSGDEKESWESMDDCGTITLSDQVISNVRNVTVSSNVSVYPNPAYNTITVSADFDKAVIANLLGQEVMTMTQVRSRTLEIGNLPKGVYFIKVYKGEKFVGSAKINKN